MLGGSTLTEVIGVRFKKVGKIYYFGPEGKQYKKGENVIVETARGVELGEVVMDNRSVEDNSIIPPLKNVIRRANEADVNKLAENALKEKEAFSTCEKKIAEHKLDMKLVDVEYTFDNNKILFYFTADGRIDFRDLVKDLASIFRTRIELRQIGVRDEAKMQGGLGICGNPFCCATFLGEFVPVSIKMAKEQGLSLNPTKISGTCGRLMCCLKYEQDGYEELLKITPKVEAIVDTPSGKGMVIDVNVLKGNLRVRLDNPNETVPKTFHRSEVKLIKDAEIKLDKKEIEMLKKLEE
jgi:cell fate regulator YaaT (PSP1 superfamily)